MKRSLSNLNEALEQQLSFLQNSCKLFDSGEEHEAIRIAAIIRILVHDTAKSKSLFSQLSLKEHINFIDSASPFGPVAIGDLHEGRQVFAVSGMPGLFAISPTRQGVRLVPQLQMGLYAKGQTDFNDWWNKECIPGNEAVRHSRKWLIIQMANKEGGAHVDPEISKGYSHLKVSDMGMTVHANGVEGFINSPANVSVRQIAWEIFESLKNSGIVSTK